MDKENIENSVFIKYHKISKWKKIKEWFRKKWSRNKKSIDKELENKNNLYDFIKNNLELVSLFLSFMAFLIDAFLSLNVAVEYNIPIKFVGIDMKTYIVFFIIFSSPLIYIYFFRGKFDKKVSFFLLTCLEIVFLLVIIMNRSNILYIVYTFFKEKIWGIYLSLIIMIIVIILVNFLSIFLKNIIAPIVYIMILIILFIVKAEWGQIITLKNSEMKVVVGYSDGEYLVADYEIEENLKIYKKPIYKISSSDINEIELKKFKEINLSDLSKGKELQIITLNNGKQRVILSEPNGEYGAFDFKEEDEKLIIYKIPSYEIITSEIKNIEPPKEFKEVEYKKFMLTK